MENQQKTKKCSSCQTDISFEATRCPYCGKSQQNWFRRHPIISVLLGIIIFSNVIGSISSLLGSSATKPANRPTTTTTISQDKKTSGEIADGILAEQKARTEEVHAKVASLVKEGRYQEAKNALIQRQEEIVATMAKIRQNNSLSTSDKERVLQPMAAEATGIAEEVRVIGEADIDELLRMLE